MLRESRYWRKACVLHGRAVILGLSAVLLLQSCSTVDVKPSLNPQESWEVRRHGLSKIDEWHLQARIGVTTPDDSGSANLFWQQRTDGYSLRIVGPFGRGALLIEGSAAGVILKTSDGDVLSADTPELLIWQQTGWLIPVSDLRYWIVGLPAPGMDANRSNLYELDDRGRISRMVDDNWTLEYRAYQDTQTHELPDKLRLYNEQLQIRLAISNWEISPQKK